MHSTLMALSVALSVALAMVGCGGGAASQPPPDEPQPAVEPQPVVEPQPAEEPVAEPEPIPSGPVEVTVAVRVGNEDASADVRLLDANGEAVYEGASGQAFTVPSGTYSAVAHITDAQVLIDTPTITVQDVSLAPGEPRTIDVRFPVARVVLHVSRNGRPLRRGRVKLYHQGDSEVAAEFRLSTNPMAVSPGRYEADITTGNTQTRVHGLTFMDGARQNIPVNIQ